MQCARERDVVDVVAGGGGEGTFLPPSGHAAIHETRIALQTNVRTEAQALGNTGPISFNEHIGARDQPQRGLHSVAVLEVERHGAAVSQQRVFGRLAFGRARVLDTDHLRAQVSEHHGAEGCGSDTRQLDDFKSAKRAAHDRRSGKRRGLLTTRCRLASPRTVPGWVLVTLRQPSSVVETDVSRCRRGCRSSLGRRSRFRRRGERPLRANAGRCLRRAGSRTPT